MINPVKAMKKRHLAELEKEHYYSHTGYAIAAAEKAKKVEQLENAIARNRKKRALHETLGFTGAGKSSSKRLVQIEKNLSSGPPLNEVIANTTRMRCSEARKLLIKRKVRNIVRGFKKK